MRCLPLPQLVLSVLLQLSPILRVATADAALAASPIIAVLRWLIGASAVAGSFHALSGATITVNQPPGNAARATNGIAAGVRVDVTYSDGRETLKPKLYTAENLPPGLLQPKSSGGIWRITGTPTESGVFSDILITAWEGTTPQNSRHSAEIFITITVVDNKPAITAQPASLTVEPGAAATFSVTATGGNLSYQWRKGDLQIDGATAETLTIDPVTEEDAGTYQVFIQNSGGGVLSDPAILTVNQAVPPPTLTLIPHDTAVHAGDSVTFSAAATGAGPFQFQWFKNTQTLPNSDRDSFTIPVTRSDDAGSYTVAVTGVGGTTTSPAALLAVVPPLRIEGITLDTSTLHISFNGISGHEYVLEATTDLVTPTWLPVAALVSELPSSFAAPVGDGRVEWFRIRTK